MVIKDFKELTEKLDALISAPIYNTYICFSVAVEEAQVNKMDIHTYKSNSSVSEDYKKFIDEFLKGRE